VGVDVVALIMVVPVMVVAVMGSPGGSDDGGFVLELEIGEVVGRALWGKVTVGTLLTG
jgi:hypothetical protein